MSRDPYKEGLIKGKPFARAKRSLTTGVMVAIMDHKMEERGLSLMHVPSRALLSGEIHELLVTDEDSKRPGDTVNRVAVLGFFEINRGGVVVEGDQVTVAKKVVGRVIGFDDTHMPNHINVVIKVRKRATGIEMNFKPGDEVVIREH
ncbi:MAG: hypothetical protein GTN80_01290 [Nitrososphaeria archaeon]|nr:hypothetical protein [Nitrososphaeria archaeon]NIQ32279.1 hypothetical protein [Nitrososphaeria archaeon]